MKKKSFIVIVIILVLVILGLCGYIVYDKDLFNLKNSGNDDKKIVENGKENNKVDSKEETLNVNSSEVTNLINQILDNTNNIYTSGSKYFGYYFQKDNIDSENIDDGIVLYTALKKVLKNNNISSFSSETVISKDEIVPVIKEIFGDVKYENRTLRITPCDPGTFIYDSTNGTYTIEPHGCGGVGTSVINHKITNAIKKDNTIQITLAIVYADCYSDGMTDHCKFGNSVDDNQKVKTDDVLLEINENIKDINNAFDFDTYMDKLNKYKFTFTKDSGNNYVFTKVEKI